LNSSFGNNGIVTTDIPDTTPGVMAIAVQTDGKIVAVGASNKSSITDFAIVRYNPDGSLDETFGTGGRVLQILIT